MSEDGGGSIPTHDVEINGQKWTYESIGSYSHQWSRPLREDEFDWNSDEVEIVGRDGPVRVVSLERHDEWTVEGLETAGPDYHRAGFTENISSDYIYTTENVKEAVEMVKEFLHDLS